MKKPENQNNPIEQFVGYEDARVSNDKKEVLPATTKAVKAALNRINPDENSQDRG